MREEDRGLNAKTMNELIIPAFKLINEYILSMSFKTEWIEEPEKRVIRFIGADGEDCEFSARAENRWKSKVDPKPFPVVVFNFRTGNFRTVNVGSDLVEGLTPRKVLMLFKGIFPLWLE